MFFFDKNLGTSRHSLESRIWNCQVRSEGVKCMRHTARNKEATSRRLIFKYAERNPHMNVQREATQLPFCAASP